MECMYVFRMKTMCQNYQFPFTFMHNMNAMNLPIMLSRYLIHTRTAFLLTKEVKCLGIICLCLVINSSYRYLLLASYTFITNNFHCIID